MARRAIVAFVCGTPKDGAGVFGNNRRKLHVCLVGNFEEGHSGYTGPPSPSQINSLKVILTDWAQKFRTSRGGKPRLVGHNEITLPGHGSLCPGSRMPMDQLREWYATLD